MTTTRCTTCHIPIARGQEVKRTTSAFSRAKLVVKCRPCAEDSGWIDFPTPRRSLSEELDDVTERGVAQAEAWANGARK